MNPPSSIGHVGSLSRFGKSRKKHALFTLGHHGLDLLFAIDFSVFDFIIKNRQLIQKIYIAQACLSDSYRYLKSGNLFFFLIAYLGIALATPVGWSAPLS